jgi:glycosyltransferase involved in cell wall biosynthesis
MTDRTSVSVVVPAYNEEHNLRNAVASVIDAASAVDGLELEIIIVNDGSSDGTAAVAGALEADHPFVRTVHHTTNQGFGASFLSGLEAARHEWITLAPGDNVVSNGTLRAMLRHAGKADLVCAYLVNTEHRARLRNVLSSIFSAVYTLTFNVNLRYIHATPVYNVHRLRLMNLNCRRYSFPSEITIKLLRQGCTFMELPGYMNPTQRKSSALRLVNLTEVLWSYFSLMFEVFVSRRDEYSREPLRIIPDEEPRPVLAAAEAP